MRPDVAEGPDDTELTGCGRAVEMPVAGSALPGGHSALVGFFLVAQLFASVAAGATPFVCTGGAVTVAVDEAELVDAREEDEFWR